MPYTETYHYLEETQGFHCWEYRNRYNEKSKLYIPKWRVPEEIPRTVSVTVRMKNEYLPEAIISEKDAYKMPEIRNERIVIMADFISEHSSTVRYDARRYNRQIHSLYIPYSFFDTDEYPKSIEVVVEWN